MTEELIPTKVSRCQVTRYFFQFPRYGWAAMVVDEELAHLYIQSDWGNWSYGWTPSGIGPTSFPQFLVSCDSQYLAQKLATGTDYKEIDIEYSKQECISQINDDRNLAFPDQIVLKKQSEECFEQMAADGLNVINDEDFEELNTYFHGYMYEQISYKPNSTHQHLTDKLLPALMKHLKETL